MNKSDVIESREGLAHLFRMMAQMYNEDTNQPRLVIDDELVEACFEKELVKTNFDHCMSIAGPMVRHLEFLWYNEQSANKVVLLRRLLERHCNQATCLRIDTRHFGCLGAVAYLLDLVSPPFAPDAATRSRNSFQNLRLICRYVENLNDDEEEGETAIDPTQLDQLTAAMSSCLGDLQHLQVFCNNPRVFTAILDGIGRPGLSCTNTVQLRSLRLITYKGLTPNFVDDDIEVHTHLPIGSTYESRDFWDCFAMRSIAFETLTLDGAACVETLRLYYFCLNEYPSVKELILVRCGAAIADATTDVDSLAKLAEIAKLLGLFSTATTVTPRMNPNLTHLHLHFSEISWEMERAIIELVRHTTTITVLKVEYPETGVAHGMAPEIADGLVEAMQVNYSIVRFVMEFEEKSQETLCCSYAQLNAAGRVAVMRFENLTSRSTVDHYLHLQARMIGGLCMERRGQAPGAEYYIESAAGYTPLVLPGAGPADPYAEHGDELILTKLNSLYLHVRASKRLQRLLGGRYSAQTQEASSE